MIFILQFPVFSWQLPPYVCRLSYVRMLSMTCRKWTGDLAATENRMAQTLTLERHWQLRKSVTTIFWWRMLNAALPIMDLVRINSTQCQLRLCIQIQHCIHALHPPHPPKSTLSGILLHHHVHNCDSQFGCKTSFLPGVIGAQAAWITNWGKI